MARLSDPACPLGGGGGLDPRGVDTATQRFLAFVRVGDRAGMESLLREYREPALAQARRILGNAADAEDAVQDAFLRLMRDANAYDGSVTFPAMIARLVQCASRDLQRSTLRRRRRERAAGASVQAEASAEPTADEDRLRCLRQCVAELPDQLKAAIELHYFDGLPQKVVAERLGVGESAVAMRLQRAKLHLRRHMRRLGILIPFDALDAHLRQAGTLPAAAVRSVVAAEHARQGLHTTALLASLVLVPLLSWTSWRALRPVSSPSSPVATRGDTARVASPAAGSGMAAAAKPADRWPHRLYEWHFNDGPPRDFHVLEGSWHYLAHGGVGDSGCMQIDSDTFTARIDHPMPHGPLLATLATSPRTGMPANFQLLIVWNNVTYDYEVLNSGRPEQVSFPRGAEYHAYLPIRDYLGADSHDSWYGNRRTLLQFLGPVDGGPMKLVAVGRQRIDDITIDAIAPSALPDVSAYRRAVYAMPRERRQGITLLPGAPGLDARHPAAVHWWLTAPDAPLLPP